MRLRRAVPLLALFALAATFVPAAIADAALANASLSWSPNPVPTPGGKTAATYGVAVDANCPAGATFTGTLTVKTPDGRSTATVPVIDAPCGKTLMSTYPTDFAVALGIAPNTDVCGVYTASWAGITSVKEADGSHPSFFVDKNFTVNGCPAVPEFGAPAMLVAAMGLVFVVLVKRGKLFKF